MLNRLFDIIFSLLCLFLLWPFCLLIALMIKLESPGPVIFKQKRVGKNQHPYYIYKFRSMRLHADSPEDLGPVKNSHTLVTRTGYFLRRFKLDELPQFINVLLGQMSVIGPRPCLFSMIENMSAEEKRRFHVLPGITGWAEVNGNLELTWHEQLMLDLWYVDHKTFWLDKVILWKTITTVFFGSVRNNDVIQEAKNYLGK